MFIRALNLISALDRSHSLDETKTLISELNALDSKIQGIFNGVTAEQKTESEAVEQTTAILSEMDQLLEALTTDLKKAPKTDSTTEQLARYILKYGVPEMKDRVSELKESIWYLGETSALLSLPRDAKLNVYRRFPSKILAALTQVSKRAEKEIASDSVCATRLLTGKLIHEAIDETTHIRDTQKRVDALIKLAGAQVINFDWDEAKSTLDRAKEMILNPAPPSRATMRRTNAWKVAERREERLAWEVEVLTEIGKRLATIDHNEEAQLILGAAAEKIDLHNDSVKQFEGWIKIAKGYAFCQNKEQGRSTLALASMINLNPHWFMRPLLFAEAYESLGEVTEARLGYQKAFKLVNDNPDPEARFYHFLRLGLSQTTHNESDASRITFAAAIEAAHSSQSAKERAGHLAYLAEQLVTIKNIALAKQVLALAEEAAQEMNDQSLPLAQDTIDRMRKLNTFFRRLDKGKAVVLPSAENQVIAPNPHVQNPHIDRLNVLFAQVLVLNPDIARFSV